MKIDGKPYRTIWPVGDSAVEVIDQTRLPHELATRLLERAGAKVVGCAFVIDLPDLGGSDKIRALGDVTTLVSFGGH